MPQAKTVYMELWELNNQTIVFLTLDCAYHRRHNTTFLMKHRVFDPQIRILGALSQLDC